MTLVWAKHDGRDEVVVRVTDFPDDDHFEIPAEPARALDVGSVQMVPRAATW